MIDNWEDEYRFLWDGSDRGWVLLRAPDLLGGYSVFHKTNRTYLLIESDETNAMVCKRMLDLGFEVLESVPTGEVQIIRPNDPCV